MNLPQASEAALRAKEIRDRLRSPANAKQDPGINLSRPKGVTSKQAALAALKHAQELVEAKKAAEIAEQKKLKAEREALIAQSISAQNRDWLFIDNPRANSFPPKILLHIRQAVADEFDVPAQDISSVRRTDDIVVPRHVAFYLCKTMTIKSFPEIGRAYGGRDHTTILHGVRKTAERMRRDPMLCYHVAVLEAAINLDLIEWRNTGILKLRPKLRPIEASDVYVARCRAGK